MSKYLLFKKYIIQNVIIRPFPVVILYKLFIC